MPHEHHCLSGAHAAQRYLQIFRITLLICAVQMIGGWFSNSIALFSDSIHVASDGAAAFISYKVEMQLLNSSFTKEGEAAFRLYWMRWSGMLLLLALGWVLWETWERFHNPSHVVGLSTMLVAAVGGLGNYWQLSLVPHDHTSTSWIQRWHVVADFGTSIAVVVGGFGIWMSGWNIIDPVLSVLIALLVGSLTIYMMWTGKTAH